VHADISHPAVDPLIPVLPGFKMAGLKPTRGYEEVNAGRLRLIRNGRRSFLRASEIQRYINALEALSEREAA